MQTTEIALQSIHIPEERQRHDLGDLTGLMQSMQQHGLINPIAVNIGPDGKHTLIAGHRRLMSMRELGWAHAPVHCYANIDTAMFSAIEFAENCHRKGLSWQEDCAAVLEFHLFSQETHEAVGQPWSVVDTAEFLSISERSASRRIRVARAVAHGASRFQTCLTLAAAHNILAREDQRIIQSGLSDEMDQALSETGLPLVRSGDDFTIVLDDLDLDEPEIPQSKNGAVSQFEHTVQHLKNGELMSPTRRVAVLDFIDFAREYRGPRFNLIHIDPPYGLNYNTSAQGNAQAHGTYADTEDDYWNFLEALFTHHETLMQRDTHILLWFSMKNYTKTRGRIWSWCKELEIPYYGAHPVNPLPLIWHKSDNTGILEDPKRGPRNIYEPCFLITLGDRYITRAVSNVLPHPVRKAKAKHLSEKPVPVVSTFLSMLVDGTTVMADFCCGSGSAIVAAQQLGAAVSVGLDRSEHSVETAREALRALQHAE